MKKIEINGDVLALKEAQRFNSKAMIEQQIQEYVVENGPKDELSPIIIDDDSPEILKRALRDLVMAKLDDPEREQTLGNSDHCEELSSMADTAKMLNYNIGRNKLFEILRVARVLNKNNKPYQRGIDSGYFKMKLCCNENLRGYKVVLVTVKGIKYINRILTKNYKNKSDGQ